MPSNAWSSFTLKPWLCLTAFQAQKHLMEVLRDLAKVLLRAHAELLPMPAEVLMVLAEVLLMSRKLLWLILILL